MNKLIILIVLIFSGCVCTEESYPEKTIYIKYDTKYKIDLLAAKHSIVIKKDAFLINNIVFYEVRGGKSLFLEGS